MQQPFRALPLILFALGAPPRLSSQAPADHPFGTDSAATACLNNAITSHIEQARQTFPAARARFQAGLPGGYRLSITTRLHDSTGHFEQVFIQLDSIRSQRLFGRINSPIGFVKGFRLGQPYDFADSELLDWTITTPDGTEEGNLIGKFIDSLQAGQKRLACPKRPS